MAEELKRPPHNTEMIASQNKIGDYRILRTLSTVAGKNRVYQGAQYNTGASVAIKMIPKHAASPFVSPNSSTETPAPPDTTQPTTTLTTPTTTLQTPSPKSSPGGSWKKEYKIMCDLVGVPNIIQLIEVIENPKSVNFIMEFAQGGDLANYIDSRHGLPPAEAWRIFKQLLQALSSVHKKKIVHRDIKPENIFLDSQKNVLLGDFGLSCKWSKGRAKNKCCGSFGYMAPCLLQDEPSYEGPEIDVWSAGVCLYRMLFNKGPFEAQSNFEEVQKTKGHKLRWKEIEDPLLVDLFKRIFVDRCRRATIEELLQHDWLASPPAGDVKKATSTQKSKTKKTSKSGTHSNHRRKTKKNTIQRKGLAVIYEEPEHGSCLPPSPPAKIYAC